MQWLIDWMVVFLHVCAQQCVAPLGNGNTIVSIFISGRVALGMQGEAPLTTAQDFAGALGIGSIVQLAAWKPRCDIWGPCRQQAGHGRFSLKHVI